MKLTRREALARGVGLVVAALCGWRARPAESHEAHMTASEALRLLQQHNPILDDLSWKSVNVGHCLSGTVTYTFQQSHDNADWRDAAYYLCGPGFHPPVDMDQIDLHDGTYVRMVVKS